MNDNSSGAESGSRRRSRSKSQSDVVSSSSSGKSRPAKSGKLLTLGEATAYLGITALELANLVELGIVHPHIGRDGTLYRIAELQKHRAVSRCPQCKEHFAVTGRRKEACTGCEFFPPSAH